MSIFKYYNLNFETDSERLLAISEPSLEEVAIAEPFLFMSDIFSVSFIDEDATFETTSDKVEIVLLISFIDLKVKFDASVNFETIFFTA